MASRAVVVSSRRWWFRRATSLLPASRVGSRSRAESHRPTVTSAAASEPLTGQEAHENVDGERNGGTIDGSTLERLKLQHDWLLSNLQRGEEIGIEDQNLAEIIKLSFLRACVLSSDKEAAATAFRRITDPGRESYVLMIELHLRCDDIAGAQAWAHALPPPTATIEGEQERKTEEGGEAFTQLQLSAMLEACANAGQPEVLERILSLLERRAPTTTKAALASIDGILSVAAVYAGGALRAMSKKQRQKKRRTKELHDDTYEEEHGCATRAGPSAASSRSMLSKAEEWLSRLSSAVSKEGGGEEGEIEGKGQVDWRRYLTLDDQTRLVEVRASSSSLAI
eukprot:jgi/Bigna1/146516/aug1.116_g21224